VLKVINSFVNTRGGDLIIGVEDENNKIIGLEQELKHFYSKKHKTLTKQKDEFDREFALTLRTFFEINFIGKDKNISSEFVEMEDGALVYHVSCSPSIKPCVINKVEKGIGKKINEELKGKEYFIRKKSESLPLDGAEKGDYIFERASLASGEE
ncbi:MAG: putative DNA binding domain-containing protein, partial [SAR202 cluster bacterium]|nr:putative DNA binding domain-containing protein [SAR202 cluster bacterium]